MQSVFMHALGYAIINSLVQMALLWSLMQVVLTIFTTTPRSRYHIALITQLTGFTWFVITFCRHLNAVKNTGLFRGYPYAATVVSPTSWQSLSAALPWLAAVYLLLLVVFITRWINGYYYTTRLQSNHCIPATHSLQQFVNDRSIWMGITKRVQVYVSEKISSPLTTGFIRPVILIPLASINHLTITQLEAVLLHELAHIRRLDFLWNIVLTIIETILFFNPFTRLIGKRIATEREYSCDDWVLQYNYQPVQYAEALLNIARLQNKPAFAMAAVDSKQQLTLRIKRMLGIHIHKKNYGYSLMALAGVAILSALLATTQSAAVKQVPPPPPLIASRVLPVLKTDTLLPEPPVPGKYKPYHNNAPVVMINKEDNPAELVTSRMEEMIAPEDDSSLLPNTLVSAENLPAPPNEPAIAAITSHIPINVKLQELTHMANDLQVYIPVKDMNVYKEVLRLQVNKIMQQVEVLKKAQADTLSQESQVVLRALRGNDKKLKEIAIKLQTLQNVQVQRKKDGTSIIIINGNTAGDLKETMSFPADGAD